MTTIRAEHAKLLLLENVNDSAVGLFEQAGYTNLERLPKALDGAKLLQAVKGVHVLGIRSRHEAEADAFHQA